MAAPKRTPLEQADDAAFEKMLATATPREGRVRLCLAGALNAELEELEEELVACGPGWSPGSLADADPRVTLAERIEATRERMKASERVFRMRSLDDEAWSDLLAAHPARDGKQELFNAATLPRVLIAACCVDPVMTPEQYDRLAPVLNQGQRNQLFNTAWDCNTEATAVPFSLSASAILAARTDAK